MGQDGDHRKVLGGLLDRDARHPQWSADSRTVYFLADDHGATHVYAARADGTVRKVTEGAERSDWLSLADNGRAATVRSMALGAGELVAFAADLPGGATTLAAPNRALLAERATGAVEEIDFASAGNTVEGWLVWPPEADRARPVPLVVVVSGEPREMAGYEFPLEAHMLAAGGYAVLRVNARGSPGYGEVFGNLLASRLPGDDFDDAMRAVEAAIAKGGIDPKRVALIGGAVAAWALGPVRISAEARANGSVHARHTALTTAAAGGHGSSTHRAVACATDRSAHRTSLPVNRRAVLVRPACWSHRGTQQAKR